MAKQTINIGTTANDGTGEGLRDAFDKVNDNFDELYSISGGGIDPAFNKANDAYSLANGAYNYANTIISETDLSNSAFIKANSAYDLANSAYIYANTIQTRVNIGNTSIVNSISNGAILFDKNGVIGENSGLRWDNANTTLQTTGRIDFIEGSRTSSIFSSYDGQLTFGNSLGGYSFALGKQYSTEDGFLKAAVGGGFAWASAGAPINGADLFIRRDTTGTLAQRNGTANQAFNIYNTYTDASNYERGFISWKNTANTFVIGTEAAGTGVARNLQFVIGGVNKLDYGITNSGCWSTPAKIISSDSLAGGYVVVNASAGIFTGFYLSNPAYGGSGGARINSPSDANIILMNYTATDFGRLMFGGTSNTFPAIKRSGANLQARLADDSAYTNMVAAQFINPPLSLASNATITWDANQSSVANVTLSNTAVTINVANAVAGGTYMLFIKQGLAAQTVSTWVNFKWPGNVSPTLSTTANSVDIVTTAYDGTYHYAAIQTGY